MMDELKRRVFDANLDLAKQGLVTLTWGNVSGIDREAGLVAIKPSGVPYDEMRAKDMVVVDLAGGIVEAGFKPSSDLPTHLALYQAWPMLGGVCHTHSIHATMFAQAGLAVPCLGTTHADHWHGPVPVTRLLRESEVVAGYEASTGSVIVERFADTADPLDPAGMPGALVAGHGPFTWGADPAEAVTNAVALEAISAMALGTLQLAPSARPLPGHILDKHFGRKHGPGAYYGQKKTGTEP